MSTESAKAAQAEVANAVRSANNAAEKLYNLYFHAESERVRLKAKVRLYEDELKVHEGVNVNELEHLRDDRDRARELRDEYYAEVERLQALVGNELALEGFGVKSSRSELYEQLSKERVASTSKDQQLQVALKERDIARAELERLKAKIKKSIGIDDEKDFEVGDRVLGHGATTGAKYVGQITEIRDRLAWPYDKVAVLDTGITVKFDGLRYA